MADEHFVDKYQHELIQRVCNIGSILDELLDKNVIQQESYDRIRAQSTNQDKMRELYSGGLQASTACKDVFYEILEKNEPYLTDDLKRNSNSSWEKMTWQQMNIKYKNSVRNAAQKKSDVAGTRGGPPPARFSAAEELALEMNKGRPVIEGIKRGSGSESMPHSTRSDYIRVMPNSVCLPEPPDTMLDPGEGSSTSEEDEETVSVCSRRPRWLQDTETLSGPFLTGATNDNHTEDVKTVYKLYLLKRMDALDVDIQYKRLKMRKLELEIQQLEKDASST